MKMDKYHLRIRCDSCGRKILYRDTFITLDHVKCIDCLVDELDYSNKDFWENEPKENEFKHFTKIFRWVLG